MKLSEAILLGSTVVKPKAGALRFSSENSGCALGMAVIASGGAFRRSTDPLPATERRTLNVEDLWGAWLLQRVHRPCDCRIPTMLSRLRGNKLPSCLRYHHSGMPREMRIKDIVAHLFDYHVMEKKDWTLDRLTAWLQPFEPDEPAPASSFDTRINPRRDYPSEDPEWQRTRLAFEHQMKPNRHRLADHTK